jgi:tRNA threonylcarbamoyladenosine biosynthesis protein TsaE
MFHGHASTAEAMEALGEEAGKAARAGAVFALVGDLGAGKTHWTKGLARGLGHAGEVTSPTFSLAHEYRDGRLPAFHFDFYRIATPDELLAMGWDEYLDQHGVVIAEWAGKFPELLPADSIWLEFRVLSDGIRDVRHMPTVRPTA